jgi:hypothetical protein
MRHDQIHDEASYARVDIAAVWPASSLVAPAPLPEAQPAEKREAFMPTPAAPDVPAAVGGLIAASYFSLLGAFTVATVGSAESILAIVVCVAFMIAFFTVPRLFFGIEPKAGRRPSFDRFMREGMETLNGRCGGRDALIQMLIVPVLLTLAVIAIGIVAV